MNISNGTNAISANQWSTFMRGMNTSVAPWSGVILGTSVTALTALGVYHWSQSDSSEFEEASEKVAFNLVKDKVCRAYGYVIGGFALTGATAIASHVSGISRSILQNPYLTIPIFLGSCISLVATMTINKENVKAKHVAWGIFNTTMGMALSPIGYLNQKIVAQAAAFSLGLGGILTTTVFLSPNKKFLEMEAPLMAALTSISIASTIALFFPASAFAYGVDRVSLYGGLAIFTGLFMSSTQRLVQEAETQTDKQFDAITSSMNIYLDGLNIFLRILRIMLENQEEKAKS